MAVIESVVGPRSRYRTAWLACVVFLAVVGVLCSFVFVSWDANLAVLAVAASMYASVQLHIGLAQGLKPRALIGSALEGSLRLALAALAACGYVGAVGSSTLLLVLVIAGTSPPVVIYLSESTPDPRDVWSATDVGETKSGAVPRPKPQGGAGELSVEELCLAWRRSFTELSCARTDQGRLAVVSARDSLLGELEQRDPQAFAEWLDSGPRAAGDPTRYFTHRADRHGQPD
ncbi:hypothetical protein GCM10009789_35940 [Kribbella sancticallisti]|uniref:Uncharacterized protein n=1 Tax=Kribbella sancticallisti TaxID=460087 RepID=A0ABP4PEC6_9ACTN